MVLGGQVRHPNRQGASMVIDVARRARAGGVAAAAVVALVLLAALGGPVGAASEATFTGLVPGAVAQVVGSTGGPNRTYTAGLMALTIDGTPGAAGYCIDIHTGIPDGTSGLQEVDWSTSGVGNLDAVERILRSYHPNGDGPDGYRITGTTAQMAAATQAAIWHFTDGFELAGQGNDPVIAANYEAILAAVAAGVLPTFGEPGVSLDIEAPGTTEATAGEPIGPYVVRTTAGEVTLTASPGAEIVHEHGAPLPGPVTAGTSLWLVTQEQGSATGTGTPEATGRAGRAGGAAARGPGAGAGRGAVRRRPAPHRRRRLAAGGGRRGPGRRRWRARRGRAAAHRRTSRTGRGRAGGATSGTAPPPRLHA